MKGVQMKNWIVVFLVLFMGVGRAQQGTFKIGFLVGPQNAWLFNSDDSDAGSELDYKTTFRFAGGISASYNFTDYLGVGIDLLYSSQGQKYSGTFTDFLPVGFTAKTTLNYLKIPVLFRVNSNPDARVQFTGFIGPQMSLLLNYKEEVTMTGIFTGFTMTVEGTKVTVTNPTIGSETEELTDKIYRGIDFGACMGFGATFLLSDALQLNALIRLDYGFMDVENKEAAFKNNPSDKFWEGMKPKYQEADSPNYQRPKTSNATGALVLGLSYLIGR
jgi:hypothetical protein